MYLRRDPPVRLWDERAPKSLLSGAEDPGWIRTAADVQLPGLRFYRRDRTCHRGGTHAIAHAGCEGRLDPGSRPKPVQGLLRTEEAVLAPIQAVSQGQLPEDAQVRTGEADQEVLHGRHRRLGGHGDKSRLPRASACHQAPGCAAHCGWRIYSGPQGRGSTGGCALRQVSQQAGGEPGERRAGPRAEGDAGAWSGARVGFEGKNYEVKKIQVSVIIHGSDTNRPST